MDRPPGLAVTRLTARRRCCIRGETPARHRCQSMRGPVPDKPSQVARRLVIHSRRGSLSPLTTKWSSAARMVASALVSATRRSINATASAGLNGAFDAVRRPRRWSPARPTPAGGTERPTGSTRPLGAAPPLGHPDAPRARHAIGTLAAYASWPRGEHRADGRTGLAWDHNHRAGGRTNHPARHASKEGRREGSVPA
jgi:hypothetical protein